MKKAIFLLALVTAMSWLVPARAQPALNILLPAPGATYSPLNMIVFFTTDQPVLLVRNCTIDSGAPVPCPSGVPIPIAGLADGPHTVRVDVADFAGGTNSATVAFFIDGTPPTITNITMTPSVGDITGPSPTFRFESSDSSPTTFSCAIDGITMSCASGEQFQALLLFDGAHELRITAQDAVGNAAQATFNFTVDGRAPIFDVTRTVVPQTPVCRRSSAETQLAWLAVDERSPPVRYRCSLDGAAFGACNGVSPQAPQFAWRCLADGAHRVKVVAYDIFDNVSTPQALDFVVDPAAVLTSGGACLPNACAGPDQGANEVSAVSLDGSLSTYDTIFWTQIAGPQVVLSGVRTERPSFTTPVLGGRSGSQVLTFRLEAGRGVDADVDTVDVTVRNGNVPPEAQATAPLAVKEASVVTLFGLASFDPDGDAIATYEWLQLGGPAVQLSDASAGQPTFVAPLVPGGVAGTETLTFQLRVSDGDLWSAPKPLSILVEQVNHAPAADAGSNQTVTEGALVALTAAGSSDPDGDPLTYKWTQVSGEAVALSNANTSAPSFTAPQQPPASSSVLGFELAVSDGSLSSTALVSVTVQDSNEPPFCGNARATRAYLWPPNHKMVAIGIEGVTDRENGRISIAITGVSQDEPVNGVGDGDTSPDAVIQGSTALLRAERSGAGNGRVYQVRFTANDGQGGTCDGTVQVVVPVSAGPQLIVNDGAVHDSTAR